jgi:hypothetical protein
VPSTKSWRSSGSSRPRLWRGVFIL